MSRAQINGISLVYDVHGSGTPLLLIMGLGAHRAAWHLQIPALASSHHVIDYDNRGSGGSEQPSGPYSMSQLAADAVGLLDHLGLEAAHIFGISMGGMVAQHIALDWPQRVRGLVLGCTSCGAEEHIFAEPWVMELLQAAPGRSREQLMQDNLQICFSPAFVEEQPDVINTFVDIGMEHKLSSQGYMGQLTALYTHATCARLAEIKAPTLVMHGSADILIPVANGRLLAERIPGARLVEFEGAGHCFFIEEAEATNRMVLDFLAGVDESWPG